MSGDGPLDERTLAALRVHSRTSPLSLWLAERFDQLAPLGRIGSWRAICELAAEEGLTDTKGRPLRPAVVSGVWSRLRRTRARQSALAPAQATVPSAPVSAAAIHDQRPMPAMTTVQAVAPSAAKPLKRSPEQVDALIRINLGFARVKHLKMNQAVGEARALDAQLRAECRQFDLPLPAEIFA